MPRFSETMSLSWCLVSACRRWVVKHARQLEGCLPAKAINLLDAVAARAALAGKPCIPLDDVCFTAERLAESSPFEPD